MKTHVCAVILLGMLNMPLAADEPVEVKSGIREVTVFLHGAQVNRQATLNLAGGNTTLAFRDLPVNMDPESIQAGGEGNFVILSLLHQVNYLASARKTGAVRSLQDTLKMLENKLAEANGNLAVLKSEEELLAANRDLGGKDRTITMTDLKLAADFYRARLTGIKKEQIRLSNEAGQLTQKIERVRNQLNTLNADINKPTSEILVNLSANGNTPAKILLTYTVRDAGWSPLYDIRAKDVQSPVQLGYHARVFQNTGEDWDKVSLKLSTANPGQRGEKPVLQPWYIDFEQPPVPLSQVRENAVMMKSAAPAMDVERLEEAAPMAATAASFTEVSENQTNLEFNIRVPYDIPSDNKPYTITIQENSLPAVFEYYCAPRIDKEAFLVARVTGWEDLNLLSGEVNLFFEGTFVGKSSLNVRNTKDTLDLSLGRDKGIVVTREKRKDFTEQRTIGSNIRETRSWEITIRNTKKQPLNLRLEDQFPVSMNKDIEMEPLDYAGGAYNKETGLVTWRMKMAPSDEKKLRLSFAVRYPKDKRVFIE